MWLKLMWSSCLRLSLSVEQERGGRGSGRLNNVRDLQSWDRKKSEFETINFCWWSDKWQWVSESERGRGQIKRRRRQYKIGAKQTVKADLKLNFMIDTGEGGGKREGEAEGKSSVKTLKWWAAAQESSNHLNWRAKELEMLWVYI